MLLPHWLVQADVLRFTPLRSQCDVSPTTTIHTRFQRWTHLIDAVLVTGPAGAGKSTFCASLITHAQSLGRSVHLFNLDPAADKFEHPPSIDIKDLVSLEEVMDDLQLGPNGGLIYCFEYLMNNLDWLQEQMGDYDDDYASTLIIDCPGQIELYTHIPVLPKLAKLLTSTMGIQLVSVYLLESQFMEDTAKYFSGVLSAMSCMVGLEVPSVNVMSKMDLVKKGTTGAKRRKQVDRFLDPDPELLRESANRTTNPKFHALNSALVQLIEDFNMVQFLPLDVTDEESIGVILSHIDNAIQYGEHEEPKEPHDMDEGDFDVAE
ncbi:BQ5605_C019g08968 [Microbotryum silenes-dioicae]|uniref:GPN-loop GTPase 3 n=1 Tax=Microbotryum silenes-dioicae TaxID=796604 RepID=A0A2X0NU24_9BASI|nr:BQ5605_C019g08968 [Microbotryum silenes-dioicae]